MNDKTCIECKFYNALDGNAWSGCAFVGVCVKRCDMHNIIYTTSDKKSCESYKPIDERENKIISL